MSTKEFKSHVASSYPVLWIDTDEYERAINELTKSVTKITKHTAYKWDIVGGISKVGNVDKNGMPVPEVENQSDPMQPIDFLIEKCGKQGSNIVFVQDFHLYVKSEQIWRKILNHILRFKSTANVLVIVSPVVEIPPEIERYVTVLDFALPDKEELKDILVEACQSMDSELPDENTLEDIVNSGTGLSAFEFENAIYHSMVLNKGLVVAKSIHGQKQQLIRKNAAMQVTKSDTGFEMIAGLDNLKDFVPRMVGKKDARGIMVVGVPGGGKSAFAKALGKETNRMTIELEIGNLQGGIVGETERKTREAFKTIDAMEPAILFIDEIEKGLAGVEGYSGDSGTSKRQGGQVLKWLNDHKSDVYTIATCNNIDGLPPEFLRAERWDAIFFVDLPNEEERTAILNLYKQFYGVEGDESTIDITDWTGAEIKNLCKLSKNLGVNLAEAAQYVCPIAKTASEKIEHLRSKVRGTTVPASKNVVRSIDELAGNSPKRKITQINEEAV